MAGEGASGPEAVVALVERWEAAGQRVDGPNGSIWCARFDARFDVGNPPLLCLHGFPTNAYDWWPVIEDLRAERDVVVLDVHGFGLSDKPDHRYSIRGYCDDVEAVIASASEVDALRVFGGEPLVNVLRLNLALDALAANNP